LGIFPPRRVHFGLLFSNTFKPGRRTRVHAAPGGDDHGGKPPQRWEPSENSTIDHDKNPTSGSSGFALKPYADTHAIVSQEFHASRLQGRLYSGERLVTRPDGLVLDHVQGNG
jgi:hypothetical protein